MASESEKRQPKVLVAIQDTEARERVRSALSGTDVGVEVLTPDTDPLEQVPETSADLLVVRRSRVRSDDLELVEGYTRDEDTPRLVVLHDSEPDRGGDRARLLAAGAAGVLEAGDSHSRLRATVEASMAPEDAEAARGRRSGRDESPARLSDFLSRSPSMQRFLDLAQRVAGSESSLLITGETGVGKERLAQALHNEGPRDQGPFISVNCGALPEHLLESELFGHEAGAFTGATRRKKGRFELADGGTIFLDEMAEMPLHLQVNLLSVLQSHSIIRVGSEETVPVDVRVMAATNRDVAQEVREGRFREDLYYRLNVVNLEIPPLRDRREDIPDLVGGCIRQFRSSLGRRQVETISDGALEAMLGYPWPGNVRELVNAVEHAVVLCQSHRISLDDLPDIVAGRAPSPLTDAPPPSPADSRTTRHEWFDMPLRDARRAAASAMEREYLDAVLTRTGGRVGQAARQAGITARALYDAMKRHGLRKEDYR